jgi:hypothetical protein
MRDAGAFDVACFLFRLKQEARANTDEKGRREKDGRANPYRTNLLTTVTCN